MNIPFLNHRAEEVSRRAFLQRTAAGIGTVAVSQCLNMTSAYAAKPFFTKPVLFGLHRGGGKWRPEHTLDTYKEALSLWPHALLEMDVRITKDGAVILHHDRTVDRTTDGTGPVSEMTLAEVQALDAGYTFSPDGGKTFPYRGKGLRIATMEEALDATPDSNWLIEPKTDDGVVQAMAEVVKAKKAKDRILIAAFKPQLVEEAEALLPGIATCYTTKTGFSLLTALRTGGQAWKDYTPEADMLSLMRRMVSQYQLTGDELKKGAGQGHKGAVAYVGYRRGASECAGYGY